MNKIGNSLAPSLPGICAEVGRHRLERRGAPREPLPWCRSQGTSWARPYRTPSGDDGKLRAFIGVFLVTQFQKQINLRGMLLVAGVCGHPWTLSHHAVAGAGVGRLSKKSPAKMMRKVIPLPGNGSEPETAGGPGRWTATRRDLLPRYEPDPSGHYPQPGFGAPYRRFGVGQRPA